MNETHMCALSIVDVSMFRDAMTPPPTRIVDAVPASMPLPLTLETAQRSHAVVTPPPAVKSS